MNCSGNRLNHYHQRPYISLLIALAILCSFASAPVLVDSASPASALQTDNNANLHQAVLDLTNPYTVMCVAAHPDDEDGTTLTILRRKQGVHTVSLFSTYGEGGQNAIGPQLYEELGVIRAKETMRASEIQGSEPYFLGLTDFGFSKSAEEAFRIWNHDEALRRMVLKLRELRPNVIITNHDTSRGHGHHQATGQLIIEAFDAAADANRFPEQLANVKPWQAQRLFVRLFGADQKNSAKVVAFDPNEVDAVRGTSFAAQALEALQQHASQGPWPKSMAEMLRSRRAENGKLPLIRYRLEREASNIPHLPNGPSSVFDGLDPAIISAGIPLIDKKLVSDLSDPNAVLDTLTTWRKQNSASVPNEHFWQTRIGDAFATAAGVSISISADKSLLVRNEKTTFTITLANSGPKPVDVSKLTFWSWGKETAPEAPDKLLPETEATVRVEVTSPADARYTVPQADHLYDGLLFGSPFKATANMTVEGAAFQVSSGFKVDVVPAVEIVGVSPSPCVRTEEALGRCRQLSLKLTNHTSAPFRGSVKIRMDRGAGQSTDSSRPLVMAADQTSDESIVTSNKVPRPADLRGLRRSRSAVVSIHGPRDELIVERPVQLVYSNAHVTPNLSVGYVPSFDQTIEQSLAALGVEAKSLSVNDIQSADLSAFNTIILDNRAYEAHPELVAANNRLLEFVKTGGTLIVFYHKTNEWNPDPNKNRPQLAPYPIMLADDRVTDETAAISFIQPGHPLLNSPNHITQADFANWIQERGLYYPKEWDNHYAALFAMNDKGETPLRGGVLVAPYGKGKYIYTSMVWYRQLRAGVPGAYRMFANMISYK